MKPLFSVLMSVYAKDRPEWVRQALDSVLANTVKPTEVVTVIDGPIPPELQAVLTEFTSKYPQIKLFPLKKNGGLGPALAYGLQQCSHELVARMDADDISHSDRFEKQLAYFIASPETAVLGGQIQEVDGESLEDVAIRAVPQTDGEIKEFLRMRCPFNHMTVMFKKSAVLDAGNYTTFHLMEDYYLWARMAAKGYKMANLPDIVLNARVDAAMYGRRGGWKYFKSNLAMSQKLKELNLISWPTYLFNVGVRFCVQVLMPNNMRKLIYEKGLRWKPSVF
ncbi:MAG: glycosyltransferase [Elusimicrobiaceae bacterium]|nr:glycosyltransferase [Elusimicrobiaceae bacterium]